MTTTRVSISEELSLALYSVKHEIMEGSLVLSSSLSKRFAFVAWEKFALGSLPCRSRQLEPEGGKSKPSHHFIQKSIQNNVERKKALPANPRTYSAKARISVPYSQRDSPSWWEYGRGFAGLPASFLAILPSYLFESCGTDGSKKSQHKFRPNP
jgi:hypothetical protein